MRPATLLKKRPWHRCCRVNFAKFQRTTFFTEHLWTTAVVGYIGFDLKELKIHWKGYFIVLVIKHANFQLYRAHPNGAFKKTENWRQIHKTANSAFYTSSDVPKTCWKEKKILERKTRTFPSKSAEVHNSMKWLFN